MSFSFFSHFFASKETNTTASRIADTLHELVLDTDNVFLQDFTIFHHETMLNLDLLLFIPHYGLYVGEKNVWNIQTLKGTSVERLHRQNKKTSPTRMESAENSISQKLQDVLSFDSTPVECIFWMENLSKAEFETLDPSFHKLLPKERLIFHDNTAAEIQIKLYKLRDYQPDSLSTLKVIGSLKAHTLLLPSDSEPFGSFLSNDQQTFLDAPFEMGTVLTLSGPYNSGKSTAFIRKVMHYLLTYPNTSAIIITPTLLGGELLRKEFVALMEFAAVKCDLSLLHFHTPSPSDSIVTTRLFKESTLIACDDVHLLNPSLMDKILAGKGSKTLLQCGVTSAERIDNHILHAHYRNPTLHTVHFSHTKGALFALLSGLKKHLETTSGNLIMIILPNTQTIIDVKKAIETHLGIKCRVLNADFSLQYDNLKEITLSTPEFISGLNVPHSYLINLNPNDLLYYPLALSRASETITIISESNLEG